MKKVLLLVLFLSSLMYVQAQEVLQVIEAKKTMSQGVQNSMVVELRNVDETTAIKEWRNYVKKFKGKTKREKKTKNWFTDDAKIKTMSNNTIDIYAAFNEDKKYKVTTVTFWFNLGGAYISSELNPTQYGAALQFLNNYKASLDLVAAEEELTAQMKALKSLEDDLKKLEKDNNDYHKKIEDAKKMIAEMEQNIDQNTKDQENKRAEINTQLQIVENAKEKVSRIKN